MDEVVRLEIPISEPDGFTALYGRESERVLVYCARRVLDAEAAVDLMAETFAQAFRGRRGFRGATEVEARAWLLTIARRQIGRYLRRGALDRRAVQRLRIQVPRVDAEAIEEIERHAGLPQLREEVGVALAQLGDEQREALRLRIVEERSYAQIAGMLGIREATVRARVSRGLRTLQAALEPKATVEGGT